MDSLSILIKPASGSCNMRCKYCFYADVMDRRETGNHGMMDLRTLETVVKSALFEARSHCTIGFQGGEPLLRGLPFFQALIDYEARHNAHGTKIHHSIQSNGTLLTDEWAEFFAGHGFLVGLSIDAHSGVHDKLREDADGCGTHARALKAAATLRKHNVQFNVLSVISGTLAKHPQKAYAFYRKNSFTHVQFIPCMDGLSQAHGSNPYSLTAKAYGRFLCEIFDLWYEDVVRGAGFSIRMFDNYLQMLIGMPPENCGMSGFCQAYPLIEADGSVYPCDFYVLDEYRLGHIGTDSFSSMLASQVADRFVKPSRQPDARCQTCAYGFLCRGGCRRDREPMSDGRLSLNCYCEAYKTFFDHALPRLRQLASRIPR